MTVYCKVTLLVGDHNCKVTLLVGDRNGEVTLLVGDRNGEVPLYCDLNVYIHAESHRRRSNTAQRLDKLKRDKHKQSQIKHVPWQNTSCPGDDNEYK